MIASALLYLLGVGTGVLYTHCWQRAAEADRQEKLKGNPSKWGQR
jgi:hypothetical protein